MTSNCCPCESKGIKRGHSVEFGMFIRWNRTEFNLKGDPNILGWQPGDANSHSKIGDYHEL